MPERDATLKLNPTAASLLGFLQEHPLTGWDLERAVDSSIGHFWNVTRSQIYRELRALDELGLVTAGSVGPRERRPFTITRAGREAFGHWIDRLPAEETIRFPLLLTVYFGDHLDPERRRRYLAEHELRHRHRLDEYEQAAQHLEDQAGGPAQSLRFGIEYERTVLRWFASLPGYRSIGK